jgi:hypothetical protein
VSKSVKKRHKPCRLAVAGESNYLKKKNKRSVERCISMDFFVEKDVSYPWTFCISGRFVDWTFCRGGCFVSMDVLYLWTFCIYGHFGERMFCREGRYAEGHFVEGRFVEGRFVEGRFVLAPYFFLFYAIFTLNKLPGIWDNV